MGTLSFDTSAILGWLLESTMYISIFVCIILMLKAVTKAKLPAWWSYGLWLLLVIRMLVPWGIESRIGIFNYMPAIPANETYMPYLTDQELYLPFPGYDSDKTNMADIIINDVSKDVSAISTHSNKHGFSLSLDKVLLVIWLAGAIVLACWILIKNLLFWVSIRNKVPVKKKDIIDLFENCRKALAVRRNVALIVTGKVQSPALYGYFKPRLLLPPNLLNTLEKDELRFVFLHELGHMKSHDIGVSWLVTVLQLIHWFNPFVWYGFHHLRVDQEVACDAYVLSHMKKVQPADYANTIVDILERFVQNRQLPSLAGIIENKSHIRRRIAMIMNFNRCSLKTTFTSILMLFVVGLIFFTSASGLSTEEEIAGASITQVNAEMNRYENRDWHFSVDIPSSWTSPPPPQPIFGSGLYRDELIRFGSNEDGNHFMSISISPGDPKDVKADMEYRYKFLKLRSEKYRQAKNEQGTSVSLDATFEEVTVDSKQAFILDIDETSPREGRTVSLNDRKVSIIDGALIYTIKFGTTNKDAMSELFEKIIKSFKCLKKPDINNLAMRSYISEDQSFELKYPAYWNVFKYPPFSREPGVIDIQFVSPLDSNDKLEVYRRFGSSVGSLEDYRQRVVDRLRGKSAFHPITKEQLYKIEDLIFGETIIASRNGLTLEYEKELVPAGNTVVRVKEYFFEDDNLTYRVVQSEIKKMDESKMFSNIILDFKINDVPLNQQRPSDEFCPPDSENDGIVYNADEVNQPPTVARRISAIYPESAKKEKIEGQVLLKFIVGIDGYVHDLEIVNAEPEGIFEDAALAAVEQYKFKPAMKDGKCVNCTVEYPMIFNLPGNTDLKNNFAEVLFEAAYQLDQVDEPPRVIRMVQPKCPDSAKEEGIQGTVILKFIVGTDGITHEAMVVSAEPPDVFEEAALEAIGKYRFLPGKKNGENVSCVVKMPIKF